MTMFKSESSACLARPTSVLSAVILFACSVLPGCSFDPSGLSPFDDRDAGSPDASGPCAQGEHRCQGYLLQVCSDNSWQDDSLCDWGCLPAPLPHCGQPRFSNGVSLDNDTGSEAVVFSPGTTTIDTDTGEITSPSGEPPFATPYLSRHSTQVSGPGLRIIGFQRITIPNGAILRVIGASALALVAKEEILVSGRIEALGDPSGQPSAGGYPGGGAGSQGQGPGGGGAGRFSCTYTARSGGGGGGGSALGGMGGTAESFGCTAGGGAAGSPMEPPYLSAPEPMVGGSGGGGGGDGGRGGSGGGAVMLAAGGAVEIQAGGVVNVGGGGGAANNSGGGGGSGGMVLIQSRAITIAGMLAANGGGGGGAGAESPGTSGTASDSLTPGGGTHGGWGGAGASPQGTAGTTDGGNAGGGGGAAGRILLYSATDAVITSTDRVSPHEGTAGFFLSLMLTE
ncbi:MAG: hypothetical protein RBU30_15875 [Polyangia bacterium]|nr:hypothetical protein [Polyangia bacterium]